MPPRMQVQVAWPRPSKTLLILMGVLVVVYVLQLLFLRGGAGFITDLYLSPQAVFEDGWVWQPFTYMWLHRPDGVFHLLFNLLWLWIFGTALNEWWGDRRFVIAYGIFGVCGAILTLLVSLLSLAPAFEPLLGGFWFKQHLGASGAVMGVTVAWGLVFAHRKMHFLLLGEMSGKTFVLLIVAIELLVALSFDPVSSTSHFGGMLGALVLVKGYWRPSKWTSVIRTVQLKRRKRKIESELRVLRGGQDFGPNDDDPKKWN